MPIPARATSAAASFMRRAECLCQRTDSDGCESFSSAVTLQQRTDTSFVTSLPSASMPPTIRFWNIG